MKKYLLPDVYVDSILDIPLAKLHALGIRAFIMDLDNTVTKWNSMEVSPDVLEWIKEAKDKGFRVCIVSNGTRERVLTVAQDLRIPFVSNAGKPRRKAFYRALEVLESTALESAVIGDQIFTDILGGNRMDLLTILVVPIDKREFIGTRLMRRLEYFVLGRINQAVKRGDINAIFMEHE